MLKRRYQRVNQDLFSFIAWLIILWTVMLVLWLYIYSIRHGGIPDWDGFERCSSGAQIWHDLRHGDWRHFWHHTNHLVTWPFLHAWATGFIFLVFGPSITAARFISLLSFLIISGLTAHYFLRRKSIWKWLGAAAAWSLFTTAPIVADNAVNIMSEMPGLLLVLSVIVFLPTDENRSLRRCWISAFFLTLLFYFKYNFSALTYTGLFLNRVAAAGYSPRKMENSSNAILLVVPIILFSLWFLVEPAYKWSHYVGFAVNNPLLYSHNTWENVLFYPTRIPSAYFAPPGLFWISVAFAVLTLPWNPSLRLKNPVCACFLVHFAAALIHPMKMDRFQFIPMGLWFILMGESVMWAAPITASYFSLKRRRLAAILCAAILIPTLLYQAEAYRRAHIPQEKPYLEPLQAALDQIDLSDRVGLLIPYDYVCAPSVFYYYITQEDQLEYNHAASEYRWTHIYLFRSRDSVLELSEEQRIDEFYAILREKELTKIILIECTFPPYDKNYFDMAYGGAEEIGRLASEESRLQCVFEREYPNHRARVQIFSVCDAGESSLSEL